MKERKLFIVFIILASLTFLTHSLDLRARLTSDEPEEEIKLRGSDSSPSETEPASRPKYLRKISEMEEESLQKIPGVGEVLAERIADKEYYSERQLKNVEGVGEVLLEDIKTHLETTREKPAEEPGLINLNEADGKKLEKITGIGPVYAERIIENRPFRCLEELSEVKGIGEATLEKLKEEVSLEPCSDIKHENGYGEKTDESTKKEPGELIEKLEELKEKSEKEDGEDKEEENKKERREEEMEEEESEEKEEDEENETKTEEDKKESKEDEEEKVEKPDEEEKGKVDINTAESDSLKKLTGIGPVYAERIIENRPFCSLEELTQVKGIGEVTLEDIENQDLIDGEITCPRNGNGGQDEKDDDKNGDDDSEMKEIKINTAKPERLEKLTGIGSVYAERITDKRPFCELRELKKVSGIGPATLEDIKSQDPARLTPPENCFEKNLAISNLPETIKSDQILKPEIEIENLEKGDYELTVKIEGEEKKREEINREETGKEKRKVEIETTKRGDIDFKAEIRKGNEAVVAESETIIIEEPEEELFTITFKEKSELENVKIEVEKDDGTSHNLTTDSDGKAEKELKEGTYDFKTNLQGYKNLEGGFNLSEDKTREIELKKIKEPENMLKNPRFESWEASDKATGWTVGHFSRKEESYGLIRDTYFDYFYSDPITVDPEETYFGKLAVKSTEGTQEARLNIREGVMDGDWLVEKQFNVDKKEDWKIISLKEWSPEEAMEVSFAGGGGDNDSKLKFKATWFSTEKPPENWPK